MSGIRWIVGLTWIVAACTSPTASGTAATSDRSLADGNEPPAEATLCELQWGASTVTDVLEVLGRPDATRDDHSGPTFDYLYDRDAFDDVMLSLFFTGQTFTDAQLSNLSFPRCWSDDIAELRRKKLEELDADEESSSK